MPLFSIITLHKNCPEKAIRTAQSVCSQSFKDFEYIIKDGGSSLLALNSIKQITGAILLDQPDRGIYNGMNQALTACTGQYVCFMNAGDVFATADALKKVSEVIQYNSETDFIFGDIVSCCSHPMYLNSNNKKLNERRIVYRNKLSRFYMFRKMICHQSWFVKKSLFGKSPFDEKFQILADYDFLLKIILKRKCTYSHLSETLVIFEGGGVSNTEIKRRNKERKEILCRYFNFLEQLVYGWITNMIIKINHVVIYRYVYPFLSNKIKDRLTGM